MAGDEGFEPPNGGTRTHCLTTWRIPNLVLCIYYITELWKMRKILVKMGKTTKA